MTCLFQIYLIVLCVVFFFKKVAKYKLHFPLVLQSTRAIEHFEIPEVPFTYKMICKELPLRIMCSQMAKLLPYMKYHFANSLV